MPNPSYTGQPDQNLLTGVDTSVKPSSSTQPKVPEFTAKSSLPNKELNPFSEDEDEVLHNQPQEEDDEEEARLASLITTDKLYFGKSLTSCRLLESQIASEAEAATVAALSRLKWHSDDEDDDDAKHEANTVQEVKKAKQKKPKKPKVTVAEAASRINVDDLEAFLAEIILSVSFL
ncbi:hypothetical protein JHK87_033673 [Glycine soja]|nr:hypothetical protein JHK87_033673 [Glycine soja]